MPLNKGKQFEKIFKQDFKRSIPGCSIDRIKDVMSGYAMISNVCDFIAFACKPNMNLGNIYYLECKSHRGNTFPFTNLSQYDQLTEKVGLKGVRAGVVLWFIDHDQVWYVPISTITRMKEDNKKSINVLNSIQEGYNIYVIPSIKKRVFLQSNYSVLLKLKEGE